MAALRQALREAMTRLLADAASGRANYRPPRPGGTGNDDGVLITVPGREIELLTEPGFDPLGAGVGAGVGAGEAAGAGEGGGTGAGDEAVAVELPAGGGMFFSGMLPHQTPPNRSSKRRRALQFHYRGVGTREVDQAEYDRLFAEPDGTPASCAAATWGREGREG